MSQSRAAFARSVRCLLAGVALVGLVAAAACGGADIATEHSSEPGAKPLTGPAPPLGRFERSWRTTVKGGDQQTTGYLVGGGVVLRTDDGLQGYDARTGKRSWRYRELGRDLQGIAMTGGVVVVNTNAEDGEGRTTNSHTLALDAVTGKILWQNQDNWSLGYPEASQVGGGAPAEAEHGTVLIRSEDGTERLGINARTGEERWKVSEDDLSDGGCASSETEPASTGERSRLIGVRMACPDSSEGDADGADGADGIGTEAYGAVDAVTGDLRWAREVPRQSESRMQGGYTLLRKGTQSPPTVLGPGGDTVYTPGEQASCPSDGCQLEVADGRLLLGYTDSEARASDDARRAVIDPRTGKASVHPAGDSLLQGNSVVANGRTYDAAPLTTAADRYLMPQALRIGNMRTGAERQVPLPEDSGVHTAELTRLPRVVGAAGGRVIVLIRDGQRPMRLAAYERTEAVPEPVELAGMGPRDWPQPCALLDGLPVNSLVDEDAKVISPRRPDAPLRVGKTTIAHTACDWNGLIGTSAITVSVFWVASSAREAAEMFPGRPSQRPFADEEIAEGGSYRERSLFRIDNTIVAIETDDMDVVGRTVAKNLRAGD